MGKTTIVLILIANFFTGCAMTRHFRDEAAVRDTVIYISKAIDNSEWESAISKFYDEVLLSYTNIKGTHGVRLNAENAPVELKKIARAKYHNDILKNFEVEVNGKTAKVLADIYIRRIEDTGNSYWDLYGKMENDLVKTGSVWKVNSVKVTIR